MIQQILIGIIFIGAVYYVAQMIYQKFTAKSGCASGCGKCGALDVDAILKAEKAKSKI
ncbi:FeoB-associated Cys-rich membrane protein [Pseudochryseolinea flava]|uniref:FeoB-associated Cys-rich membrane protein n=1 Tax=Pseudochryseolinea flava TaxID=2059302 RepID=A0A364Y976_9BACT|nr:FeoB-associated Cys-rich membrane protein [Pseudochryseolinea flava]RAW02792.1 FeoB-associated Cys-rich membrane protein [Pseudochryseolinea flava]